MNEKYSFAGFSWPKRLALLPAGPPSDRLKKKKKNRRTVGDYYQAPSIITDESKELARGFYLTTEGQPGLRWEYCDAVTREIRHTGWHTAIDGDGETIRGIVFRLPKGRGFLSGWTMGENMISVIFYCQVHDDEIEAAHAADSIAESAAEKEKEMMMSEEYEEYEEYEEEDGAGKTL